jgi:hypothetical protein
MVQYRAVPRSRALRACLWFVVACTLGPAVLGQGFHIQDLKLDPAGRIHVSYPSDTNSYYILYRGRTATNVALPVSMALGISPQGTLDEPNRINSAAVAFYRVRQVPIAQPLDIDGDGLDDVIELRHAPFLNPLDPTDGGPLRIKSSSPADGETDVAVTRETIVYFSGPLADAAVIGTNNFYATFGGRRIL